MATISNTTPATVRHKIEAVRVIHCGGRAYGVTCTAVSGARYHLKHHFNNEVAAHGVAAKVACKGTIDPSLWDLVGVIPGSEADRFLEARATAERRRLAA